MASASNGRSSDRRIVRKKRRNALATELRDHLTIFCAVHPCISCESWQLIETMGDAEGHFRAGGWFLCVPQVGLPDWTGTNLRSETTIGSYILTNRSRRRALKDDLGRICDYTEKRFGAAQARRAAMALYESADGLKEMPLLGRAGRKPDTRELRVPGLPFVIVYRAGKEAAEIIRILHGSQQWP